MEEAEVLCKLEAGPVLCADRGSPPGIANFGMWPCCGLWATLTLGGGGKDFGRVGRGCFLPEARQPHTAIPSEAAAADRAEDGPNEAEEANGFLGLPGFLVMFGFGCCDGCDAICRK